MLIITRILFTGLFVWQLCRASRDADSSADIINAGNFALAIIIGLAAGVTWAPVLGEAIAGPITGTMTDGSVSQDNGRFIRFIRRCEARGWRRITLVLCFLAGVARPNLPAPFIIGMRNARACSWLEMIFAKEVFRFNNVANCVRAHDILKLRHDIDPGVHAQAEVNLQIMAHVRETRPELPPIKLGPSAPLPSLARNRRIKLFAKADPAVLSPQSARPTEHV